MSKEREIWGFLSAHARFLRLCGKGDSVFFTARRYASEV